MDAVNPLMPSWGSPEDWNRAFEKVEDYLRAHRVDSRLHRARLTYRVLAAVAADHPADPPADIHLETLAIEECRRQMTIWFRSLSAAFPPAVPAESVGESEARVALLLCDQPRRWPYTFMEPEALPEEMSRALNTSILRGGPDLAFTHMVPRSLDLGLLPELAGNAAAMFARWPVLKIMLIWMVYAVALAALFWYTR